MTMGKAPIEFLLQVHSFEKPYVSSRDPDRFRKEPDLEAMQEGLGAVVFTKKWCTYSQLLLVILIVKIDVVQTR